MRRRRFLHRIVVASSAVMTGVVGLPIVGYLIAPLLQRRPFDFVQVGPVERFSVGTISLVEFRDSSSLAWAGQTALTALWVRRRAEDGPEMFQVFEVNCTHLGCPVNWQPNASLFLCPCHGGVFYADGTVAGGPPPRRLYEREWTVERGQLFVREARLPTPGAFR